MLPVKVVTIVSPMKFHDLWERVYSELSINDGWIVLTPVNGEKAIDIRTTPTKEKFRELHKSKIDMSDMVVVVTKDGYMGTDTVWEMSYAIVNHKRVVQYDYVNGVRKITLLYSEEELL